MLVRVFLGYTCWRLRGPRMKHCPAVGACVEGFDHYCAFSDIAIGEGNHRLFVCVLFLEILMQISCAFVQFYAFKLVLAMAPYDGRWWHLCHIFVATLFNGVVLVLLTDLERAQCIGIVGNLTYYEVQKRQSIPHFWPTSTLFQNPFTDGYYGNCTAFWTNSRRMTIDPADPWAESSK